MNNDLTEREERYLEDLRRLPVSWRSRFMGWAVELGSSTALFLYGVLANHQLFIILGFLSLMYFSVWRMYSQFRGARMIRSIYEKRLAAGENPGESNQ